MGGWGRAVPGRALRKTGRRLKTEPGRSPAPIPEQGSLGGSGVSGVGAHPPPAEHLLLRYQPTAASPSPGHPMPTTGSAPALCTSPCRSLAAQPPAQTRAHLSGRCPPLVRPPPVPAAAAVLSRAGGTEQPPGQRSGAWPSAGAHPVYPTATCFPARPAKHSAHQDGLLHALTAAGWPLPAPGTPGAQGPPPPANILPMVRPGASPPGRDLEETRSCVDTLYPDSAT